MMPEVVRDLHASLGGLSSGAEESKTLKHQLLSTSRVAELDDIAVDRARYLPAIVARTGDFLGAASRREATEDPRNLATGRDRDMKKRRIRNRDDRRRTDGSLPRHLWVDRIRA